MRPSIGPGHEVVFETRRPEIAAIVERGLRAAEIPFQTGMQASPEPRMVFIVPRTRAAQAQDVVASSLAERAGMPAPDPASAGATEMDFAEDETDESEREANAIPWKTVQRWSLLILAHLAILWGFGGRAATSSLMKYGALINGRVLTEPWRLVTSLFLHVDPPHVVWNGLSMVAFAVPLVARFGGWTTAAIYLASGVSGGLFAGATGDPSNMTVGSSGAVAGLFGAWLVTALQRVWRKPGPSRARLRVVGIGLLVLPSLLTPTTPSGDRISVASHVGGALAGIVIGVLLEHSRRATATPATATEEADTVH